ncbi:hypothetical protein FNO19_22665 [Salmonella enterica subsp. salamae]|nr:hypothetical protein [Salmonella enterica subsp. salamae]SQH41407.1 Uncharacterised protein [Salmonella enterica]
MRCYNVLILLLVFSGCSYSIQFKVTPFDSIDDVIYFTLHIEDANKSKDVDVALEGNSNNIIISQYYNFSCNWGKASGVRLSMDSATRDGKLIFDNIYAVDSQLNVLFAKSYSRMGTKWVDPVNLNSSVCNLLSDGIKKDPLTKKDYIVDFESIVQGPFYLKGVDNVSIKYIRDDFLKLIRNDINSEIVVDLIKNYDNKAPFIRTVFFMKVKSEMNIISLVSWGDRIDEDGYYRIYAYIYDEKGIIHTNEMLNKDPNLSGVNSQKTFKYKNSNDIRKYILKHYGVK